MCVVCIMYVCMSPIEGDRTLIFYESLDYDLFKVQSRHFGNLSILYSIYTEYRRQKGTVH